MENATLAIALGSLILSGVAAIVTFLQYGLAETQTSVAQRQAKIAEEQHSISKAQKEILDEERAMRAVLMLSAQPTFSQSDGRTCRADFELYVKNFGNKPAPDFAYTFLVLEGSDWYLNIDDAQEIGLREVNGAQAAQLFCEYQGKGKVYPGPPVPIGRLHVFNIPDPMPEELSVLYFMVHDGGREPREDRTYRELTLRPGPLP